MPSLACVVCDDVGLLNTKWCPLCEGFGHDDWLEMQAAQPPAHKGRLFVRRLLRGYSQSITSEEKACIEELLLSKTQRKRRSAAERTECEASCDAG